MTSTPSPLYHTTLQNRIPNSATVYIYTLTQISNIKDTQISDTKEHPPSQSGYGCFYFGIKRWCYPENNNKKDVKDIPTFKWTRLDELPISEERCNIPSYCEKRERRKDGNR